MSGHLYGGVNAAVLTPMRDDLGVDLDRLAARCRALLDEGCDGLAVLGTTGEANSLGIDERLALLDGLAERGVDAARLLPGTGTPSITDTVTLTRRAAALGCRGVLMLPPFFYKGPSEDGLFAWFSEVINRVGVGTAIYLYHFPQHSGVPFTPALIARLIRAFPGTVRGIKDSSGDYDFTGRIARAHGPDGFEVYCGDDTALHRLLGDGGAGCITAASNLTAPVAAAVYAARGGPDGAAAQARLTALRRAIGAVPPLIPAVRALVARRTGDPAWRTTRPPFLPLAPAEEAALYAAWDAASG